MRRGMLGMRHLDPNNLFVSLFAVVKDCRTEVVTTPNAVSSLNCAFIGFSHQPWGEVVGAARVDVALAPK